MNSAWPKISIVIPSYNQVIFLTQALDSLARQDYPHLEVIVMDGASTDGTGELLQSQREVVSRWQSEPDGGQTQALNKGYALATGEIFGWLNADERYRPGALRLVGQTFAQQPSLDIVFGHRVVVDRAGREIGRTRIPAMHPRSFALFCSGLLLSDATFWKADLHRRTGQLDEINCPRYAMDFDWFGRLGLRVRRWRRLEAYLSEFTEHEERVSRNVPEMGAIAQQVRRRLQRLAGIGPLEVILKSPWYFIRRRHGQEGWRGLLRPPALKSWLRVAGVCR